MENKKIIQTCISLLLFISMLALAQAAVPFESLVQKDAKGPQAPFEDLAQNNNQGGKIPFESLVQKDAKGPRAPFEDLAEKHALSLEGSAKQTNFSWLYVAFPIFIVVGMLTYIEVKRKKDHIKLMSQTKQYKVDSLKNYVQNNLRKGYGREDIRSALIKNNYNSQEIEEAFKGMR